MPKYTISHKERSKLITARFVEVYNHLKSIGAVSNKGDFAELVGTHANVMSGMITGERNVTLEMICQIVEQYPINLEFIFFGKGEIMVDAKVTNDSRITALEKKVSELSSAVKTLTLTRYTRTKKKVHGKA